MTYLSVFNTIMPLFFLILLGYYLREKNIINRQFIDSSSAVIYRIALPMSLFYSTLYSGVGKKIDKDIFLLLFYSVAALILTFIISMVIGNRFIAEKNIRGVFIQGSFRSNYIIIGYPILLNLVGEKILPELNLLAVIAIPIFNILSVIALSLNNNEIIKINKIEVSTIVLKNPLIHGIILGYIGSILNIELPLFINSTLIFIKEIAIPLALISIGYLFTEKLDIKHKNILFLAAALKSILYPLIFSVVAYLLGLKNNYLLIIFILLSSPTAVNSFVIAKEMNGNENLAANIVVFSTVTSVVSMFTGIILLKSFLLV